MKKSITLLVLFAASFIVSCSGNGKNGSITVYAAASTADLMDRLSAQYEEDCGKVLRISSASSGTLARQIEQGAEPDIYISASEDWMTFVEDLGVVEKIVPLMKNRLVLIAPASSPLRTFEMKNGSSFPFEIESWFSMGDPAHVPAGRYGKEALNYFNWYEIVKEKILPAPNVRAALSVVELEEAALGIVYGSDTLKNERVKTISCFPEKSHSPILYYLVLMEGSSKEARTFFLYLQSAEIVEQIIEDLGFSPVEWEGR